jgi:hypothetical protein
MYRTPRFHSSSHPSSSFFFFFLFLSLFPFLFLFLQLIYVPEGARPTVGAMICIIAVANLNYFRPHKTNVLFWLTELTFISSSFKYITALMIESSAHDPDATEEDIDTVGKLLIGVEIFTFVSMLFCLGAAVYVLRGKLKAQDMLKARMRNVLKTHVSMGTRMLFDQANNENEGSSSTSSPEEDMRTWSSNTKVAPVLPSSANSEVNDVALEQLDPLAELLSGGPPPGAPELRKEGGKQPADSSRLALRRQQTKTLAEQHRIEANSLDWL